MRVEDNDDRIEEALAQGKQNKEILGLINNWCRHTEISRFGGIGMIEQMYNVPIGHMGLKCKYVAGSSLNCWNLEDAAYEFYLNNCENCEFREPVSLPNILEFVTPRKKAAEERKKAQAIESAERRRERKARHAERTSIRLNLDLGG